jgi:hypothetical protein
LKQDRESSNPPSSTGEPAANLTFGAHPTLSPRDYQGLPTFAIGAAHFLSRRFELDPNSKIPALMDRSGPAPIRVFGYGPVGLESCLNNEVTSKLLKRYLTLDETFQACANGSTSVSFFGHGMGSMAANGARGCAPTRAAPAAPPQCPYQRDL